MRARLPSRLNAALARLNAALARLNAAPARLNAPPARLFQPLAALTLILAVLGALWPRAAVTPLSSYDQRFYLGIAYDIRHHGRFTDGFSYGGGNAQTLRPPGMRFTPLYPAFLAASASLDLGLRRGIECVERTAGRDPACPRAAPVARGAQWLMLAGFYWLLWAAIGLVARSARAGWIGLGIGLLTAPSLLLFVNTLMTETISLLLSTAACALAARAYEGGRPSIGQTLGQTPNRAAAWWLASGLALGLAALSRPAMLYLLWLGAGCGIAFATYRRSSRVLAWTGAFVSGAALAVLPWVLRNLLVLHRAALSFGYASHTLIQRIAFDAMTPHELAMSFVCWLPDGAGLGRTIAGSHACDRFGWDEHPDSFYSIGTGPLMQQSLAAAGGWSHHMRYIVQHYLLADPAWHLLVSIPLALRGMYVDHYWGLLLAPISGWTMFRAVCDRQPGIMLLSAPAWFLLFFNALVAVNQPRYNFLLILPFSLGGAILIERRLRHLGDRRKERQGSITKGLDGRTPIH